MVSREMGVSTFDELFEGAEESTVPTPPPAPEPTPPPSEEEPPPLAASPIKEGSDLYQYQQLFALQTEQLHVLNRVNREQLDQLADFIERLGVADLTYQREQIAV